MTTEPLTDAALALEVARIAGFVEREMVCVPGATAASVQANDHFERLVIPLLEAAKRLNARDPHPLNPDHALSFSEGRAG